MRLIKQWNKKTAVRVKSNKRQTSIYTIKLYMLAIAGQTVGSNLAKIMEGTRGYPCGNIG